MANNQNPLSFINLNNNISLSQNKWSDIFLHKNKSCRYNNLMSPLWKKKESFSGVPYVNENDVYTIEDGVLYENGNKILENISNGYTYEVISNEVLAAFSNGGINYRFYKLIDNTIQLDFNGVVTNLNINENFKGIKIIQIPTKSGYQASFGLLTITNNVPVTFIWRNINISSSGAINIESSREFGGYFSPYTEYCIVGGICRMNGSNDVWAGFSIFQKTGWQTHDFTPYGVIVNLNNLQQVDTFSPDTINVTNVTTESLWSHLVLVQDGHRRYRPSETDYVWDYSNPHLARSVVQNPRTYFYFSKYNENDVLINGTRYPLYGLEMWVRNISDLYNSSLQIGNTVNNISYNSDNRHFAIEITSQKIYLPNRGYQDFGAGFCTSGLTTITYDVFTQRTETADWNNLKTAFQLNFASASYITEDFQENVYCGCHKVTTKHIDAQYGGSFDIFSNVTDYFSIAYQIGKVCTTANIFSEKALDALNPGDNVRDASPKFYKVNNDFTFALGSNDTVFQNVVSPKGCAILPWDNINKLIPGESGVIYGQFTSNNVWFKIKKCSPYIVNKFNNYILINSEGLNAYNITTKAMEKCWTIGYNGALTATWRTFQHATELGNISVSSLPDIKVIAATVNNHPEITEDYFSATDFEAIHMYAFESFSVGENTNVYDIELYEGSGATPSYKESTEKESSNVYTNIALTSQAYVYDSNNVLYSYFLANFSFEFFFNRFGIIRLGNNQSAAIRYLQQTIQVNKYALTSISDDVENAFIIMGQIYFIIKGYIFAITLDNEFNISYQSPITECKNLLFCGNTSKKALFFSPITKELFMFTGNQIFERLQEASEIQAIITFKNCYYLNVSLISYIDNNGNNNVLLIQDERSSLFFSKKDFDDTQSEDGDINMITFGNDIIYLTTTEGITYSVAFFQKDNTYTPLEIIFESETMLGNFSQNVIDCIYVNAKKEKGGKVKLTIRSGINEDSYSFDLDKIKADINGFALLRYQPKNQQRGRVAIRLEGNVPVEDIAYSTRPIGNEISRPKVEI